jgi:hypothetical protein
MDDLREFIATARWLFAKTMAAYNPHWYVVEREEADHCSTASSRLFARGRSAATAAGATTASRNG